MLRCQCPSVCPSVTLVHWRIIANLGFKFRYKFTAHNATTCTASGSAFGRIVVAVHAGKRGGVILRYASLC